MEKENYDSEVLSWRLFFLLLPCCSDAILIKTRQRQRSFYKSYLNSFTNCYLKTENVGPLTEIQSLTTWKLQYCFTSCFCNWSNESFLHYTEQESRCSCGHLLLLSWRHSNFHVSCNNWELRGSNIRKTFKFNCSSTSLKPVFQLEVKGLHFNRNLRVSSLWAFEDSQHQMKSVGDVLWT